MAKANIRPDATNANKGTERGRYMVETSLRETGAGRSILLDADGRIIAGNKTFEAATDIGLPVRIVETDGTELIAVQRTDLDLSDPTGTARKLAYYDNRASQVGLEWDAEQVLADITAGVDLDAMFSQREIDELLADLLPKTEGDAEPQIDRAEELNKVWQVQPGDVWQIGEHRLVCGDCTDPAVVAKVMQGEKADFAFTDPPYNVGIDYGQETDDEKDDAEYIAWSNAWFSVCESISPAIAFTPGAVNVWMWAKIKNPKWMAIWVKSNQASRNQAGGWNTYEPILCYGKVKINYDTWNIPVVQSDVSHPVKKSVEAWRKILEDLSHDAQIIFDPFLGSGTTLVACQNLSRRGRGIEISPSYCAVILQRMSDAFGIVGVRMDSQVNT